MFIWLLDPYYTGNVSAKQNVFTVFSPIAQLAALSSICYNICRLYDCSMRYGICGLFLCCCVKADSLEAVRVKEITGDS